MPLTLYLKQISKCTRQTQSIGQSNRTAGVFGFSRHTCKIHFSHPVEDFGKTDTGFFPRCLGSWSVPEAYVPEISLQPLQLKQYWVSFLLGSDIWLIHLFIHSSLTSSLTHYWKKHLQIACSVPGWVHSTTASRLQIREQFLGCESNLALIYINFWEDKDRSEPRMEFLEQHDPHLCQNWHI